jgi:hypothetical protein
MRPIQKEAIRTIVRRRLLVSIAVVALLLVSLGAGTASAGGGQHATFTKWVTSWPEMAGVVGGSVGDGAFNGTVVDANPGPTTLITAIYHFEGSRHDFTARIHAEQTGLHATIVGVVTDGWGKGKLVTGIFDEVTCEHDGVSSVCWTGYLDVGRTAGD